MNRRRFIAAAAGMGMAAAQANTSGNAWRAAPQGKGHKLVKFRDPNPNALEATSEDLWVGDQVTERTCLGSYQQDVVAGGRR